MQCLPIYRTFQVVSTKLKDRMRLADVLAGFNVSGICSGSFFHCQCLFTGWIYVSIASLL